MSNHRYIVVTAEDGDATVHGIYDGVTEASKQATKIATEHDGKVSVQSVPDDARDEDTVTIARETARTALQELNLAIDRTGGPDALDANTPLAHAADLISDLENVDDHAKREALQVLELVAADRGVAIDPSVDPLTDAVFQAREALSLSLFPDQDGDGRPAVTDGSGEYSTHSFAGDPTSDPHHEPELDPEADPDVHDPGHAEREWICAGCNTHYYGRPEIIIDGHYSCYCSKECFVDDQDIDARLASLERQYRIVQETLEVIRAELRAGSIDGEEALEKAEDLTEDVSTAPQEYLYGPRGEQR